MSTIAIGAADGADRDSGAGQAQPSGSPGPGSPTNPALQPGIPPDGQATQTGPAGPALPTISAPKGGGAIRGIGEKFSANPATGTGTFTVPLAISPGRAGFGPDLSLTYDSSAGNGPFGFGWRLSTPMIMRKTSKGLPRYADEDESDTFIVSGAEDLVPVLNPDGSQHRDSTTVPGWTIHRYRPRVEGLFARIERWVEDKTKETHWRSISRDNITTLYGRTSQSRVGSEGRVFTWHICESYDAKGNAAVYEYVPENTTNVDLRRGSESTRNRGANRYLKRVRYGNRVSRLVQPDLTATGWMFEVVLDYGEGHRETLPPDQGMALDAQFERVRASPVPRRPWAARPDPFSSYTPGFEVRTHRRCQRVLMFHDFPELGPGPCLVRSTEFGYADISARRSGSHDGNAGIDVRRELAHQGSTRFGSFLRTVTQVGYVSEEAADIYRARSMPPVEFTYSRVAISDQVHDLDPRSLRNVPAGVDGRAYQWADLDGDGIPGILTEQGGEWLYARNSGGRFGPLQTVPTRPATVSLAEGKGQLLDLAGDGRLDATMLGGAAPGYSKRNDDAGWEPFRSFAELPGIDWSDPDLRFVDLDGDGLADVLITRDDAFTWYPSLAERGFAPARRTPPPAGTHEPRLLFSDGEQSVYLADMSGDGLADLVRIRNGEVRYWPNQGYGRFGRPVGMDNAPWLDRPELFDQKRIRLADIDGSGTTDVIYLGADGARIYFNQSGNRLTQEVRLHAVPPVDRAASVQVVDLFGTGTACLVWSSPLPGYARRPMRYLDLMAGQKPHLLVQAVNNLGMQTVIRYASSTRFSLADRAAGRPWRTRLPFPVHVVERVETLDRVSGNRFVTRYSYHDGAFDGLEREFRGFGMVEQWDTEEFGEKPDRAGMRSVPPVLTKTWFHTGLRLGGGLPCTGATGRHHLPEYAGRPRTGSPNARYHESGLTDAPADYLLQAAVLPSGLAPEEEREAIRGLAGSMLRQETYAVDGSARADHPYTVIQQRFGVVLMQHRGPNRHAVVHVRHHETITHHYERHPDDPRVTHDLTIAVDDFGNTLQSAIVAYGRRRPDSRLAADDQLVQARTLVTYVRNRYTNAVESHNDYRAPVLYDSATYELTGLPPVSNGGRYRVGQLRGWFGHATEVDYAATPPPHRVHRRLIDRTRTTFRSDDLSRTLPFGTAESRALPGLSMRLAFTAELVATVYENRVTYAMLAEQARYLRSEPDGGWWLPSGTLFYSPDSEDSPERELEFACDHFFLPHRHRDPFHTPATPTESSVRYDRHALLVAETMDAVGNRVTAGERALDADSPIERPGLDYRVLQPTLVMDANRNRSAAVFDALGLVVGIALMGKPEENPTPGDHISPGFCADLTQAEIAELMAEPRGPHAVRLLGDATTRVVYDLMANAADPSGRAPAANVTIARETHASEPLPPRGVRVQVQVSYSDGFGREIQKKIQAEPGPVPVRDARGTIVLDDDGQPEMTAANVAPRWVGSGWTVHDNKGNPVRRFEPFFSDTHRFERDSMIGVSSTLCYDPLGRVVATLHPNHTWEKVVFDAWRQENWDVNDTVLTDPFADADIGTFARRLPAADYLPTWHALRTNPAYTAQAASRWPDPETRAAEQRAALATAEHAATPAVLSVDPLGRTVLTVTQNRSRAGEEVHRTRLRIDIEGNNREVIDALGRLIMRYAYDMLGNRIRHDSMDAGPRWNFSDVLGKTLYAWDGRGHTFRTEYDQLRRPVASYLRQDSADELTVGRTGYGESAPDAIAANLRGRIAVVHDQVGVVITNGYDFKGNPVRTERVLAQPYAETVDWSGQVPLQPTSYASATRYDALNRPVQLIAPHRQDARDGLTVTQRTYNDANLLEQVHVWYELTASPERLLDPATADMPIVLNIDYDPKGQHTCLAFGNGTVTTYAYDPLTYRLTQLTTRRGAVPRGDGRPRRVRRRRPRRVVQDLLYTFDPAGNVTQTRDRAQQAVFFRNARVEPGSSYTYDALYRLMEATGREHLGQAGAGIYTAEDAARVGLPQPGDGIAMARYVERYSYDAVGNVTAMTHHVYDRSQTGWTRRFRYQEPSALQPERTGNRLSSTQIASTTEVYSTEGDGYDAHGNLLRMPHLPRMTWDANDQLWMIQRRSAGPGSGEGDDQNSSRDYGGGRTWYGYDTTGRRVRAVTESTPGHVSRERVYLGLGEVFRCENRTQLARATVHVLDGDSRPLALIETKTSGTDAGAPQRLVRFQYRDHLGSVVLELDAAAAVISYEEFSPFGSTVYQAVEAAVETPKRYRFTGKERDEETGFTYHGARYYIPWLARWSSCDPAGLVGGPDPYIYAADNPVVNVDRTGQEPEPYHTLPGWSGNEPWRYFLGRMVHMYIGGQYRVQYFAESAATYTNDTPIATILQQTGGDPSKLTEKQQNLKPDITNTRSREVLEIKPDSPQQLAAGKAQVIGYRDALNAGSSANRQYILGDDFKGEGLIRFKGGRFGYRLTWRTVNDRESWRDPGKPTGVVLYKIERLNPKDDTKESWKEAYDSNAWVVPSDAELAALDIEGTYNEMMLQEAKKQRISNVATKYENIVQWPIAIIGTVMTAVLSASIFSSSSKQPAPTARPGAPAPAPVPPANAPTPPPGPVNVPPPYQAPQPWQVPPPTTPVQPHL